MEHIVWVIFLFRAKGKQAVMVLLIGKISLMNKVVASYRQVTSSSSVQEIYGTGLGKLVMIKYCTEVAITYLCWDVKKVKEVKKSERSQWLQI